MIKSVNNLVEPVNNIVSGVIQMACVHADAQLVIQDDFVENSGQFLEAAADFGALPCHCLQCDAAVLVFGEHFVKSLSNPVNTCIYARADVGAGVQNEYMGAHCDSPFNLQCEKFHGNLISSRIDCVGQIDNIGGVHDEIFDSMCAHVFPGG